MRKYTIALLATTGVLTLVSLLPMWFNPAHFATILPFIVLYFAVVTFFEHYFIVRSAHREARTFIKNFLGLTVGTLILHLGVMIVYMFTHMHDAMTAKLFLIAFCIGYLVFLVFETTALVLLAKNLRKQ